MNSLIEKTGSDAATKNKMKTRVLDKHRDYNNEEEKQSVREFL
jgi:hypothetical protein